MGSSRISINGGEYLAAPSGARLFFALRERGVMLTSACGGRGLCGLCKVKVTSGGGPLAPEEEKKLTPEELESGLRLACRIVLDGDIAVEIDQSVLGANRYMAEVCEKTPLNYDTCRIALKLEKDAGFNFRAGQFVQIEIPAHGMMTAPVWRAYSLASPPQCTDRLEIIVRRAPFGIGSGYLHELASVGARIALNGPHGDFTLRPTEAPAIMLAGGSGISPFESMLADAAARGIQKPITLVFGGAARQDLYDLDLLAGYEKKLKNFRFVPALAKPADDESWSGEVGIVTDVAKRLYPDMTGMEAYLCGSPNMIGACRECLVKAGISPSKIYFDQFG